MSDQNVDDKLAFPILGDVANDNAIDKFSQFADSLKDVSPDVAKNAIEQIPEFVPTMLSMTNGLHDMLTYLLKQNAESTKNVYDACNDTLDSLRKMLSNENLKFEEKKWVIEKESEIIGRMKEINSENKNFWLNIAQYAGAVAVAVTGILVKNMKKETLLDKIMKFFHR